MTNAIRQPTLARYPTARDWIAVALVFGAAAAADLALSKHARFDQACANIQVSASQADVRGRC